ncbi:MAG TPA: cytochrome c nitrite reductase small subunit [Elusimicrobia bacterium]|nr:cytochrome c nitrite reductase small subunit [Elusimicrobiota bacterium]
MKRRAALIKAAALCGAAGLAALFLLFGPPHMIGLTETPEFCGLCHSMKPQHAAWEHSAHRQARCIDCHLPNDNAANHYLWKTIDGNKDVFYEFSGLREHDEIALSAHGHRVLQANCIRCHEGLTAEMDGKRACIDCHRTVGHKRQGTLNVREDKK